MSYKRAINGLQGVTGIIKFDPQHPVWMLTRYDTTRVVIKADPSTSEPSYRANARIAGAIDKSSKPALMSDQERASLIIDLRRLVTGQRGAPPGFGYDPAIVADLLNYLREDGNVWIKLPFVDRLTDLQAAAKNNATVNQRDKTGVRAFAEAINRAGGMERLGEIAAFDVFVGNGDRFNWKPGGGRNGMKPDFLEQRLFVIYNVSNLFAAAEGDGTMSVRLLDTWDYMGAARYLSDPLNDGALDAWQAPLLLPDNRQANRDNFAECVVNDLNMLLGARDKKIGRTSRLEKRIDRRLAQGIANGTTKIRNKLARMKAKGAGFPAGLQDRANRLGWQI